MAPSTNRTFRSASLGRQKSGHIAEQPRVLLAIAGLGLKRDCTAGSHTSSTHRSAAEAGNFADFEVSVFERFPDEWSGQVSGEVAPEVRKVARGTMGNHTMSLPVDGDTWFPSRASDRVKKKASEIPGLISRNISQGCGAGNSEVQPVLWCVRTRLVLYPK